VQARPLLDDVRAAQNLPIIGALLGEYDIGGVEECFSQCDKLLDAVPHPYHYYFSERQSAWSLANSGLGGISRFEIKEVVTAYYEHKAELADTVASKGVALMRIQTQGLSIDVYNTHMQAGDSDGAHAAQAGQADELVAFIRAHSPAEHTVVLHGDFNMSPARPAKAFEDFEPNHYSNAADMLARTANFQKIIDELGLTDVSDKLFGPVRDHIDRVLFRAARGVEAKALSWEDQASRFVDAKGAALSDSMPLVVELELSGAK
jgi:endonuclease/exonuclease/phosphatase family metal-dependent hydrolase